MTEIYVKQFDSKQGVDHLVLKRDWLEHYIKQCYDYSILKIFRGGRDTKFRITVWFVTGGFVEFAVETLKEALEWDAFLQTLSN